MKDSTNIEFNKVEDVGDEFVLHHHLGLGDSIVCNGLVNYLSKEFKKIYLPVKGSIFSTIEYLYSENEKVDLFEISNENREEDIYKFAKAIQASKFFNPGTLQFSWSYAVDVDPNFVAQQQAGSAGGALQQLTAYFEAKPDVTFLYNFEMQFDTSDKKY